MIPPERQLVGGVDDAWRCGACEHLMYNMDAKGYPTPGGPMPHYWSVSKPAVCTLCYQMVTPLATNEYWVALHREWREEEKRTKENRDKLTGRRDYLTGA